MLAARSSYSRGAHIVVPSGVMPAPLPIALDNVAAGIGSEVASNCISISRGAAKYQFKVRVLIMALQIMWFLKDVKKTPMQSIVVQAWKLSLPVHDAARLTAALEDKRIRLPQASSHGSHAWP